MSKVFPMELKGSTRENGRLSLESSRLCCVLMWTVFKGKGLDLPGLQQALFTLPHLDLHPWEGD